MQKMIEAADARIRRLSAHDVKAVMLWLESRQVQLMIDVSTTDEALESAKARGGIQLLDELNGELLGILGEIAKPEKAEEGEVDAEL
jgi:putative N-acetylmannosamine-6-phosphate epimerase